MQTDQPINSQSGSMQKGIAAPYDFQIMDVIKEAWQRTSGLKGPVLGAGALIFTALIAISFAIILFFDLIPLVDESFLVLITGTLNFIISVVG